VTGTDEQEIERIRGEFRRRREQIGDDYYSLHRPANLFLRQCYERDLVRALDEAGRMPLRGKRLLDVGCGNGGWLATFEQLGVERTDLAGVELDPEDVQAVRERIPGADVRVGDGLVLPWAEPAFDLVFQATVFTSILDPAVRWRLAREMLRVLRPGGAVVWIDFRYDNPRNRNVVGLGAGDIRELFPGCAVHARSSALVPPLARAVVPWSWALGTLLERIPPLRSHLVAVIAP
jgi:SAM-dependent methyltransferase